MLVNVGAIARRCLYLAPALLVVTCCMATEPEAALQYQSPFLRVRFASDQPAVIDLAVDSLGKDKLNANPLRPPAATVNKYEVTNAGPGVFEYRPAGAPRSQLPVWEFACSNKSIHLVSNYSSTSPPPSLLLDFNVNVSRATLLGLLTEQESMRLPALLHLPDYGTFQITSGESNALALGYDGFRYPLGQRQNDFVKVTFPAASASQPRVDYTLKAVAIFPNVPGIDGDPRFDGFRRNWLNILQINPRRGVLSNNATSDACAFCVYEYAAIAEKTPELAPGLTAVDIVRQTLDRYLSGTKGYGLVGYLNDPSIHYTFLDTYPSLLLSAWDCVRGTGDAVWLDQHYAGIKGWADDLLAMDKDHDGLFEYPASGDSGSWNKWGSQHAANWWDSIGFGNKDAYSNALAYEALLGMADMARRASHPADAQLYDRRAEQLKSAYYPTFYDPATGVLAGWKSADGKLHDDYFTFVNGAAITYGLILADKANPIMDHLLAKMHDVGYTEFRYGLPGNLIAVPADDYLDPRQLWGGGGKWGFEWYENGGATADFAYFTIQALYKLGRHQQADAILFPMLHSFADGGFEGKSTYLIDGRERAYDWRRWDGEPCGYEGFLTDGYLALLAVLSI